MDELLCIMRCFAVNRVITVTKTAQLDQLYCQASHKSLSNSPVVCVVSQKKV